MPRKPSTGEVASKRYVQLFTPTQHREYFAFALHEKRPLSDVIRLLLEQAIDRAEAKGARIRKRKR